MKRDRIARILALLLLLGLPAGTIALSESALAFPVLSAFLVAGVPAALVYTHGIGVIGNLRRAFGPLSSLVEVRRGRIQAATGQRVTWLIGLLPMLWTAVAWVIDAEMENGIFVAAVAGLALAALLNLLVWIPLEQRLAEREALRTASPDREPLRTAEPGRLEADPFDREPEDPAKVIARLRKELSKR